MQFENFIQEVKNLKDRTENIYIYGAGFYGKDVCQILLKHGIVVDGFIVTNCVSEKHIFDLPVYLAKDVLSNHIGVIVAVSSGYKDEIYRYLKENKFEVKNIIDGGEYLLKAEGRQYINENSIIEITSIMGCKVNCKYCPQNVLINKYYEQNSNRQRIMTCKDFKTILEHTPNSCGIMFAGMSEIFLNEKGLDFIQMACNQGRDVTLFTTLVGASLDDIKKLVRLPIRHTTLHVADRLGYTQIPLTEEYYQKIGMVLAATKDDGSPFIDFINAQGEPDERILEISKDKYEIGISLHDRAGNVGKDGVQRREKYIDKAKKIYCNCYGKLMNTNVILPDGTLLLCSQDYGMQHVLGNLYMDTYEDILNGKTMQQIYDAANGIGELDLLCRKCIAARIQ